MKATWAAVSNKGSNRQLEGQDAVANDLRAWNGIHMFIKLVTLMQIDADPFLLGLTLKCCEDDVQSRCRYTVQLLSLLGVFKSADQQQEEF